MILRKPRKQMAFATVKHGDSSMQTVPSTLRMHYLEFISSLFCPPRATAPARGGWTNPVLSVLLTTASLLPTTPAIAQNVVDPRCAGGVSCQIWGCDRQARDMYQKEFSNPPHCRSGRSGFADAEDECRRIGGQPRSGPGGAPFIWCDAIQDTADSSSAQDQTPAAPDPSSGERIQGILDIGIALLEAYKGSVEESVRERYRDMAAESERQNREADRRAADSLGSFAKEFSAFAKQSQDAVLGNIDQAKARCGQPVTTRLEIAECFRSLSATYVTKALECEKGAQGLSTPGAKGQPAGANVPGRPTGQRVYNEACANIHISGAKASNCVAVGILRPDTQFNSLMKRCAESHGLL